MIKNIIFDFGDIFINLDKEATAKELEKFGLEKITPDFVHHMHQFEVGSISSREFLDTAQSFFPQATLEQLKEAWNAIILDFPENRLTFIEELSRKNKYRLFLLSNTNALHTEEVVKSMGPERFDRFKNCFDAFYLSHEIGMRKPDSAIYAFVLKNNDLVPEQCLFIDDTLENTQSANTLGIQTWHLKVGEEDITELHRHLGHV